jgi:hypothetical protein
MSKRHEETLLFLRRTGLRLRLSVLCLCVLLPCTNGCGLVLLPRVQAFPGSVRAIEVVDSRTHTVVPEAQVRYDVIKYENWTHFPPYVVPPDGAHYCQRGPEGRRQTLSAIERSDGRFTVEQRSFVGWVQWFFPIPWPLGWNLYHDYEAIVSASAPGYRSVFFRYDPTMAPSPSWGPSAEHPDWALDADGTLSLLLDRSD